MLDHSLSALAIRLEARAPTLVQLADDIRRHHDDPVRLRSTLDRIRSDICAIGDALSDADDVHDDCGEAL